MTTNPKQTPAWLIERLAHGELSPKDATEVRDRLRAEGRDADAVLAELAASNRALREALPARQAAASIRARLATENAKAEAARAARRPRGWLLALPTLGAAAAAMVLVLRPPHPPIPPVGDGAGGGGAAATEIIISKGSTRLGVYRRAASGDELLPSGARAARGDLLQLTYAVGQERDAFGVVLSLDGAGKVTWHLPVTAANQAAPLKLGGKAIRLPSSYELDDAPGFERFFLVTAPHPFPSGPVLEAARALAGKPAARNARLALPSNFNQTSVLLEKSPKELP